MLAAPPAVIGPTGTESGRGPGRLRFAIASLITVRTRQWGRRHSDVARVTAMVGHGQEHHSTHHRLK